MNVVTRGVKNTLRSPIRSGAIILIFAISVALIVSMLVARSSVQSKINEVKSTAGTTITVRPAGTMGAMGGGDPLTATQLATIKSTDHISATTLTLTDQLSSDDTSLESSLEFGGFGRNNRQSSQSSGSQTTARNFTPPTPSITITGTTDIDSVSTDGTSLSITDGEAIDSSGSEKVALVGTGLAEKNNLKVGDTFTAYDTKITVKGIYKTDNQFQDSGLVMPLGTLQAITNQADVVSSVVATVDSSDNVAATVSTLTESLGDDADITSEVQRAEQSVSSLEGIASLALTGVVAAAIAGATIILLAMVMVVRERRREFGVMKAIGGKDSKVVGQFITEGLTLTVFGAFVGIALGIVVSGPMTTSLVSQQTTTNTGRQEGVSRQGSQSASVQESSDTTNSRPEGGPTGFIRGGFQQLQTNASQVTASVTPAVIGIALGITLLISLIGTATPAWLTARIRPAEVLRTE